LNHATARFPHSARRHGFVAGCSAAGGPRALAARLHLPAIYYFAVFARRGGLICYGPDIAELYRSGATYVDRILRGAEPGELPVQLPTKYQLIINSRTARDLGITVSPSLIARADEVIE
jgi:putative ABC transport system substrate-binding protein